MLKYITIIFIALTSISWGQSKKEYSSSSTESATDALHTYLKLREGYKRSDTKQFSRDEQFEMDDFCFDMQKRFPDAWETNYAWYINGHFLSNQDQIEKAYEKAPTQERVVKAMLGYSIIQGDETKIKKFAAVVSKYYAKNLLSYYEDALPKSGILIVSSEREALPLYVLQKVNSVGSTVTIVTMDYLINHAYRKRMAAKLGTGSTEFFGNEKAFLKAALSSKNVYLSSTVSQAYIAGMGNDIYITGLHYEGYIKDQKEKLENFWFKIATKNFASMSLSTSEKRLYSNYLPPLMTLYKLKLAVGVKDDALRKAIEALSDKIEQTKTVNKILDTYDND